MLKFSFFSHNQLRLLELEGFYNWPAQMTYRVVVSSTHLASNHVKFVQMSNNQTQRVTEMMRQPPKPLNLYDSYTKNTEMKRILSLHYQCHILFI